jgi:hypothetical protein
MAERLQGIDPSCILEGSRGRSSECPNNPLRYPEHHKEEKCRKCYPFNKNGNGQGSKPVRIALVAQFEPTTKEEAMIPYPAFKQVQDCFTELFTQVADKRCGWEGKDGRPDLCPANGLRDEDNYRMGVCMKCPGDTEAWKIALQQLPYQYKVLKRDGVAEARKAVNERIETIHQKNRL